MRPLTTFRGIVAALFALFGLWVLVGGGFIAAWSLAGWALALGFFMIALDFLTGRFGYLIPAAIFFMTSLVAPGWSIGLAFARAIGIAGVANFALGVFAWVGLVIGAVALLGVVIFGLIFKPGPSAKKVAKQQADVIDVTETVSKTTPRNPGGSAPAH